MNWLKLELYYARLRTYCLKKCFPIGLLLTNIQMKLLKGSHKEKQK